MEDVLGEELDYQLEPGLMALSEIVRLPRNPKDHDIGGIHTAVDRFGFLKRIIVNRVTGRMIAGHGRIDTLLQRKELNKKPPPGIKVDGEDWLVPFDYVALPESEEEAAALALNRWGEKGGYDEPVLAEVLQDIAKEGEEALYGVGWDHDDLDALLAFTSMMDDWEGPPDLEWDTPAKAWRIIVQCESEAETVKVLEYLSLDASDTSKVRYNYSDTVLAQNGG